MKIRGIISNGLDLDKCYPGHDREQYSRGFTVGRTLCNANVGDTVTFEFYNSKNVKADVVAITKTKGYAIKDNGERAFKKEPFALGKSKCGRNTATIGIMKRGKRISPCSSPLFSSLQTYPLCCQLQPHLTCFTNCFDVSSCYCYWTACPFQFFYSVYLNEFTRTMEPRHLQQVNG